MVRLTAISRNKSTPVDSASNGPTVGVCAEPASDRALLKAAARIAVDLGLPFLAKPRVRGFEMQLVVTGRRLELRVVGGTRELRGGHPIYVDVSKLDVTSTAGRRLKQPIARAVGLRRLRDIQTHPPTVVDATAGWGGDAFILASLGCRVLALERNRIVATLLRDGVLRATAWRPGAFERLAVLHCDSGPLLRRLIGSAGTTDTDLPGHLAHFLEPQVVYLDPMFPTRPRLEAKPLRVLRRLVGDDEDASRLFAAARRVARRRVVVKRPLHAEPFDGVSPTTTHKGKSVRYDVYASERGK